MIGADLYGISARLKGIDAGYFVWYDYRRRRYELHCRRQPGNTLVMPLPYNQLDQRAVTLVLQTRVERADQLWRESERENALLAARQTYNLKKQAERALEEVIK